MTSPPASGNFGQAQVTTSIHSNRDAPLIQSRETGEVRPNSHFGIDSVVKRNVPETKPWAHFVAGAYVLSRHLHMSLGSTDTQLALVA